MSAAARVQRPAPAASPPRSRLQQVQRGRQDATRRVLLYGDGGLGKSTFAASAPRPIFIDLNQGSHHLDVARYTFDDAGRLRPTTFDELLAAVVDIEQHAAGSYETLVLDVLSDVEQLVWAHVVQRDGKARTIEEVGGGFAKGYVAALEEWRRLTDALDRVRAAGLHVLLLDHVSPQKEKNAAGADYARFAPKVHVAAGKYLHGWADSTFYVEIETVLVPDASDAKKAKKVYATSEGRRLLHTTAAAEWMAKNRDALPEVLELPSSGGWQFVERAIREAHAGRIAELRAAVEAWLPTLAPAEAERAQAALGRAGDDASKLEQLVAWCASRARAN